MAEPRKTIHIIHLTPEFVFDQIPVRTLVGADVEPLEFAEAGIDADGLLKLTIIGRADPDKVSFGDKDAT